MGLNKSIVSCSIIATMLIGGFVMGNANERITTVDGKEVIKAYSNLIQQNGIEHVIVTDTDGMTLDIYRDRNNGKERTDFYDENGMLVDRILTVDYGASFLTLSQYTNENGEWDFELTKTIPPKEAVTENKVLMTKSIIEGYFEKEFKTGVYSDWKKSNTKDNLIKYTDDNSNIYVNSQTGQIEKREILSKGSIIRTLDAEVLDIKSKEVTNLFEIDSPLMKEHAIIENKNLSKLNNERKINIEDYSDEEYDSSNGKG